jgi:YD repeat-containing protein
MRVTQWLGVMSSIGMTMLLSIAAPAAAYASPTFIQSANTQVDSGSSATATFASAQSAGDLNVVIVAWNNAGPAPSVTDSQGNTYSLAVTTTDSTIATFQAVYYASNIAAASAGTNAVTVSFSYGVTSVDERVAEYSGVATSTPLDGASGATGSGATLNSGSVTTTGANDLLVAGDYEQSVTNGTSTGYTVRINNAYGDILEDEVATSAGSYSATATQNGTEWWLMSMVAFRSAGTGGAAPSAPTGLSATATSSTQVALTWTASAAGTGGAVTGYLVQRCSGAGCTSFAQIGTASALSYTDNGLTAGVSYTYEVAAVDAADDVSGWSTPASVTPGAPGTISYVQSGNALVDSGSSATATFANAQSAGDLNVVIVAWSDAGPAPSVTDSQGNTYALAVTTTNSGSFTVQSIYYASNIAAANAGSNTVTVSFGSAVAAIDERIAEYTGVATSNPLDGASGATGSGGTFNSGSVTTTGANDLLIAGDYLQSVTNGTSTGFTVRMDNDYGDILEDEVTPSAGTYSASASQDGTSWWLMSMAAFRAAGANGAAPSAPTGLSATATSTTQVALTWAASTAGSGGAVTGYLVQRCSGAACTSFAQIGTASALSYTDTGLTAGVSYSYRVAATDAAGDVSGWSATASATPGTPVAISYVQSANALVNSGSSATATFASAQSAGDLNVVIVAWGGTGAAPSVTDSQGNTYALAVTTTNSGSSTTQSIYYASNIAAASAGSNTVMVSFGSAVTSIDERIAEYSGVATSNPMDGASGATGTGGTLNSGSVTTTGTSDLLIAGDYEQSVTSATSPGFTVRINNDYGDILEDEVTSSAGTYSATTSQNGSDWWLMSMVAFKASIGRSGSGGPTTPSNVTATATSLTQVNLTWSASTDPTGVTGYIIERCLGAGCTDFTQIGTSSTTSYSDSGLTASTSYSYEVIATDSAGNMSADSTSTSAITPDLITYTYDNLKRVTQATSSNGGSVSYTYDANGNVTSIIRSTGP